MPLTASSLSRSRTHRRKSNIFVVRRRRSRKSKRGRVKVQRYRCSGCQKTYSRPTRSAIGRFHRPDLFMVALSDTLVTHTGQSVRKLARYPRLNKYSVRRLKILVFSIIAIALRQISLGSSRRTRPTSGNRARILADGSHKWRTRRRSRRRPVLEGGISRRRGRR